MGTTPLRGYPYPEPTDVPDGAAQIKALALALDSGGFRITRPNGTDRLIEAWNGSAWSVVDYDSGTRDLTGSLINGWTSQGGWEGLASIRRIGNVVRLWGYLNGADASNSKCYQIPSGFASTTVATSVGIWALSTATTDIGGVSRIDTDDMQVTIGGGQGVSLVLIDMTWFTDDAIPASLPGTLRTPAPQ